MLLRLDARIERRDGFRSLRLASLDVRTAPRTSHLRLAPAFIAALFAAYASAGSLSKKLNAALQGDKRAASGQPVQLSRVTLASAPLLQRERGGQLGWRLPDVKLEFRHAGSCRTRLPRLSSHGTIAASLLRRSAGVRVAIHVDSLAVDCRERVPDGWRIDTCFANVLGSVNLRSMLNDRLRPLDLFGTQLRRLGELQLPGFVPVRIQPVALRIDTASGEPIVDLAADVRFSRRPL